MAITPFNFGGGGEQKGIGAISGQEIKETEGGSQVLALGHCEVAAAKGRSNSQ